MSGYTVPTHSVSVLPPPLAVTLTTLVPGLQLLIYSLRPHIYSAITPEDVISSLSTPQLFSGGVQRQETNRGGVEEEQRWGKRM